MGDLSTFTGRCWRALWRGPDDGRLRASFIFVLPGIWVAVVLGLQLAAPEDVQLLPLLAAAPAIACAGTGRRQCVFLACLCALAALVPVKSGDAAVGLGERVGTFGAIMAVAVASYVISHRRLRVLRDVTRVWSAAEEAQRILLRPTRTRVADVQVAARCAQIAGGVAPSATVFYEVLDTAHGVRAVVGGTPGGDLDAVERASVAFGSFREAAYEEPDLRDVVRRIGVSLRRHLGWPVTGSCGAADGLLGAAAASDSGALWQLSDLLTRPVLPAMDAIPDDLAEVSVISIRPGGRVELAACGQAALFLIRSGAVVAVDEDISAFDGCRRFEGSFDAGDSVVLVTGVSPTAALAEVLRSRADVTPDLLASQIIAAVAACGAPTRAGGAAVLVLRWEGDVAVW